MKIRSVMTNHELQRCSPDDSLAQAARLMWEHDVGALPVTDGDRHPIAMITDRDIAMAACLQGRALADLKVQDSMSRRLAAVSPDDPVAHAEELMREYQVHRLPVVDQGELLGMVTIKDIARQMAAARTRKGADDLVQTLVDINRPAQGRQLAAV